MPSRRASVSEPDLPELEPVALATILEGVELMLDGALVELEKPERIEAKRIRVSESSIRRLTVDPARLADFRLHDVLVRECNFSNVDASEGSLRRVQISNSKLLGFSLAGGKAQDVSVVDSSLSLASFGSAELHDVVFERVDLREASFLQATLEAVEFVGCELAGADFRGVNVKGCVIRGSSLDQVVGIESMAGIVMPWSDVVASVGALADALGIRVADD